MTVYPVGSLSYEALPGDEYLYAFSESDDLEEGFKSACLSLNCETLEKLLETEEILPSICDQEFIKMVSDKKLGSSRLAAVNLLLNWVSKRAFNIAFWDAVAEGELEIAKALFESHRKSDISLETVDSCLQFLILRKEVASIKFLLESGRQNEMQNRRIGELFESAIRYGSEEIQSEMLDRCQGKIPVAQLNLRLFHFAGQKNQKMVQKVLNCYRAIPPSSTVIKQLIRILENPLDPNDSYDEILEILRPYASKSCCTIL